MPEINAAGLALIEQFEGCELSAYQDAGGVWTIGYGHTGPGVHEGETITQTQADALLQSDVVQAAHEVAQLVEVTLTPNQFAALTSFQYNTGALEGSTLLKFVNDKNFTEAADQFALWIHAGGEVLPGLVTRRAAERALFLTP